MTKKKELDPNTINLQGNHVEELEDEIAERIGNENLTENVKDLHDDLDKAAMHLE